MSDGERRHGGHRGSIELYIVRHAHAGDPEAWRGPDDERPLSPKGENQAARLAAFLTRIGARPQVILTSPRLRASQTAAPIGAALQVPVRPEPLLATAVDLVDLERLLAAAGDPERAMIVGHDPDFSELASELTGAEALPLAKGSVACIDANRPLLPGAGVLRWLVTPDLLKAL